MLVTMKNSELIDKLVTIADGNIDLVQQAIRTCAENVDGADLTKVIEYIIAHREAPAEAA